MTLSQTELDMHVAEIEEEGYTIVENAFDTQFADELAEDLLRLDRELDATPNRNSFEGHNTIRIYNLLVHGPLYERIPVHSTVLPAVERILDDGCLISSLSSISILPGERPQPIHADDQLIPIEKPHVPLVCNSMWAITDFTEDNGATRIIPGSHERDHSPTYGQSYESQPACMKKGSIMIYNGSMWHGGGENRTDERRVGIAMNYCAGFIRQQENQQLGIPRQIAKRFPKRLQELVGYSVYRMLIGHIDHGHPARVLDD